MNLFTQNQQQECFMVYPYVKLDSGSASYQEYFSNISVNASSIPFPVNADTL